MGIGMDTQSIRAIAFDFGNTLIPWDERQYWDIMQAIINRIVALAPGRDFDTVYQVYSRIRAEDSARNLPWVRENDVRSMYSKTIEGLRGSPATEDELGSILQVQIDSFAGVCSAPDGLHALLDSLANRYRLAVLSNYPVGECIRESLRNIGLDRYFDTIMVSGDLGVIKPGREIFESLLAGLDLPPEQVLFAGDDWIADVVGSCAVGMPCVHITDSRDDNMATIKGIFGPFFKQALELPELAGWEQAKPVAVLESVFELDRWLKESCT